MLVAELVTGHEDHLVQVTSRIGTGGGGPSVVVHRTQWNTGISPDQQNSSLPPTNTVTTSQMMMNPVTTEHIVEERETVDL